MSFLPKVSSPHRVMAGALGLGAVALALGGCERGVVRGGSIPVAVTADAVVDDGRTLEISWMGVPNYELGREGSFKERLLEERFNVDFKPLFLERIGYSRRKPLLMLAGSIPDVFWVANGIEAKRSARHGFGIELPLEMIERFAPAYVEAMLEYAPEGWLLTHHEGGNYGVPTFGWEFNRRYPLPGVWRMDWLRAVGIEKVPETLDEMREALWRFRHRDPDGNGKMDTYGFCPTLGDEKSSEKNDERSFGEIFGAFGVTPWGWMERGGRAVWGGVQPETRRVLALLRTWYADGLIYPDYVLIGRSVNERFKAFTRGAVGYFPDYGTYAAFHSTVDVALPGMMRRLNPRAELVPGWLPKGPDGRAGYPVTSAAHDVLMFGPSAAEEPAKIVRVLRMLDTLVTDESLYLQARLGRRDTHWNQTPEQGVFMIPPYDVFHYSAPELLGTMAKITGAGDFFVPFAGRPEWVARSQSPDERAFDATYRRAEWGLPSPIGPPDGLPSAGRFYDDLRSLQERVFTEIIRGDRDIAAFDLFVEEWRGRGGEELTAEANNMLELKRRIVERLRKR